MQMTLLIMMAIAATPAAGPKPRNVFDCAIGARTARIDVRGTNAIYTYGLPGRPEIRISGSVRRGNLFSRIERRVATAYQLRFIERTYSYIVYSMDANPGMGSAAVSGVIVKRGRRTIADLPCRRFAPLASLPFSVPEDDPDYSVMGN